LYLCCNKFLSLKFFCFEHLVTCIILFILKYPQHRVP
jgi:hypothetical protein